MIGYWIEEHPFQLQFICIHVQESQNKAGYMDTSVAYGWEGRVIEKVTWAFGQEQWAQKPQKRQNSNSRKSVRWSAVPVAPMLVYVGVKW